MPSHSVSYLLKYSSHSLCFLPLKLHRSSTFPVPSYFCPLFSAISVSQGVVWQRNASESCHHRPLIILGSSATCLSIWRRVRGQAKSSIASGESRGSLYATDKFSFTPSLLSSLNFIFHLCCHSWGNSTHLLPLTNVCFAKNKLVLFSVIHLVY